MNEQQIRDMKPGLEQQAKDTESHCIVCGMNIDAEIALLNTGRPDCCDLCSIERRDEYRAALLALRGGARQ